MPDPEFPHYGDKRLRYGMPGLKYGRPIPSFITNPQNHNQLKGTHAMASNQLPINLAELETQGRDAADGATQLGATIGLKQNLATLITTDTDALSDAGDDYNTADTAVRTANTVLRLAISNSRGFLMLGRDLLKLVLGGKASTAWAETGFSNQSLAVPSADDQLQAMLDKMQTYLTANPARENAPANFTAAQAGILYTALKDARSGVNGVTAKEDARKTAKATRDLAEAALRRRLNGLLGELGQLLDPMSPHWVTFGFQRPGAEEKPDPVKTLTATALGGGRVKLDYSGAARTGHYQICQVTDPVAGTFEILDDATATTYLLENQTVGAPLQLKVRGTNDGGDGKFSPTVQVTVN